MTNALARWSALALGLVYTGMACASPLPETPVDSWTFLRNDNGAALFNADTNTPGLGAPDGESPNTLSASAIVGTWGGDIALEIGEVARVSGGVAWGASGDGSPGLRFGLFNSDGSLANGSPGYLFFLDNETDDTFDRTTTASTAGLLFSPAGTQNLNATVLDEQGTWQDETFNPFTIEVERTGSDSTEVRFLMFSSSGDPVNINAVATHSATNGGAAARTFNFNAVGMQFGATGSNAPDFAVFFNVTVAVFVPGDFNIDGAVDAADHVAWRKGVGIAPTEDNYNLWRTNFGRTSGGGGSGVAIGSASSAVPEPDIIALALLELAGFFAMTRAARHGAQRRQ
jgi:hypothetical protein